MDEDKAPRPFPPQAAERIRKEKAAALRALHARCRLYIEGVRDVLGVSPDWGADLDELQFIPPAATAAVDSSAGPLRFS